MRWGSRARSATGSSSSTPARSWRRGRPTSSSRRRRAPGRRSSWTRSSTTEEGFGMTGMKLWRALLAMALAVAALALAACGDDDDDDDGGAGGGGDQAAEAEQFPANSTLGKIQERGEITIGVKFDVPPFGFNNPQTDEVEGFDVDIGRFIAEELGVEPNFIEAISDNRIPFLERGTVDLILSTMTINAERDMEIDFSEPYYIARGRILVPGDSGIKDGDKQLKDFVDGVLQSVEEDGRWEETYQKWVGRHIGRDEQPPDMTLQEALELGT